MPIRSYKNAPKTVRDLWLSSAQFADREYLVYQDERMTYAEAHRQVGAIGAWLAARGVGRGDRVGIAMRNYPGMAADLLGLRVPRASPWSA